MKLYLIILLLLAAIILSCSSLPKIEHSENPVNTLNTNIFLKQKYRLTHSIKANLPLNEKVLAIGVTLADPSEGSIDAVLMSVEGLVLFDAAYRKDSFTINRNVPPFDKNDFAKKMIDDIKLFYFMPVSGKTESGRINDKNASRFYCDDSSVIDVFSADNGTFIINKYDDDYDLERIVTILSVNNDGLPEKIELNAPGFLGYSLNMELIEYEKVE